MRAIEIIVIVAIVLSFYTLIAKTSTYDLLPIPNLTDLNSMRSDATRLFVSAMALIGVETPASHPITSVICEDVVPESRAADHKLIVLRLDDVQGWAWRDIAIRIVDDTLDKDIPITIGVIPKNLPDDKVLVEYLREKSDSRGVEIAQHGTSHTDQEFANVNREDALKMVSSGKEELTRTLGVDLVTFIPPENAYNENTTLALRDLGFSVLSAGDNEFESDGSLKKIGATASTSGTAFEGSLGELVLPTEILRACNEPSNTANVCVIMIHPQDYSDENGSLDEARYAYFTDLLDRLESGKFLFFTLKELAACSQPEPDLPLQSNTSGIEIDIGPKQESPSVQVVSNGTISIPVEGRCVDYDNATNTVTISCDSTFSSVETAMSGSSVLKYEKNGTYILGASIIVNDGATFSMLQPDISWLRLTETNSITVYGKIEFIGVRITSWDSQSNSFIEQDAEGSIHRAYITLQGSEGGIIKDSEISHLGYRSTLLGRPGFEMRASHDLEITNSEFHRMYFAFYSAESYNIKITDNDYHDNILYALDPHSGTYAMEISNNHVHHNKGFGIICSLDCSDILIEGNNVHDNGNAGIMLSRNTHDSIVRFNNVYNHPKEDGIVISQSPDNLVYENTLTNNTRGIYVKTSSSTGNIIERNTITGGDYGMVFGTAKEGNVVRSNTFANVKLAEYYLLDGATLTIEESALSKMRIKGGTGLNNITIQDSGELFLFPVVYDTNSTPYVQTLTNSSVTFHENG